MIQGNTIVADQRLLLGGINMVDFAPVAGNYRGTRVNANVIEARSSLIKVAIAMGPRVWSACWTDTNIGGSVTNNLLKGAHMGYGYAVSGVREWTVTGNRDQSQHVGQVGSQCGQTPSAPAGFQVQFADQSTLQPEFVPANVTAVLGIH